MIYVKEIHLMSNAHIDPVWHWKLNEGIGAALSTFRTAVEICENNDSFVFNHNEALLYMYIEKYDASLFERICKLIKQGKWQIIGGWYLQPDCVMLSGESFIRQISAGRKYFKEKFGVTPTSAVSFDAFGHTKGLVQILNKFGYDSYIFCRPPLNSVSASIPSHTFKWNGFADSTVIAVHCAPYNTPFGLAACATNNFLRANADDELSVRLFPWGVGNHGGGPSKEDVADLNELIANNENKIIHSTADAFIRRLRETDPQLPEFGRSLSHVMTGCYTSQSRIKQAHRRLENSLKVAEIMALHATAFGTMEYPHARLDEAEKCLMLSQFHDILPGSSSKLAMETSLISINRGLDIAEAVKTDAFYLLATGQSRGERRVIPMLVYNPTPYTKEFLVDCEFTMADQNYTEKFNGVIVHQGDSIIPSQLEKEGSNIPVDWRKRIVFRAELKAMSMNRFDLELELMDKKPERTPHTERFIRLETENKVIEIDKNTGLICRYEVNGKNLISQCGALRVINDSHDPWGMRSFEYNDICGSFTPATPENTAKICNVMCEKLDPTRIIEDGPVRTVVESVFTYEDSYAVIRYSIDKKTLEVLIHIEILSTLRHKMVKLAVDTLFEEPHLMGKTAFGMIDMDKNGDENVSGEYIMIGDSENTVSIIKQGIYGSSFKDGELGISLFRTPNFCSHPINDRLTTPQDRYNDCIDEGKLTFDLCLNASDTESRYTLIESEAISMGDCPEAICFYPSGEGKQPLTLCELDDSAITIERAIAQENGDIVFHLYNSAAQSSKCEAVFPQLGTKAELSFKGYEIKAVKIAKNGTCEECDL